MGKKKSRILKSTTVNWFVEIADTFNWSEPNRRMTGLLDSEGEARTKASELIKTIGAFEKLYIMSTDNGSYSFK